MGGGGYNQMMARMRGYELIYLIQETCGEFESWYDNGGEGRIQEFGGTYLVVKQTREVQDQLIDLLNSLKQNLKMQVAIEARFILVGENYLEDIGMDTDIAKLNLGHYWGTTGVPQDSYTATQPTSTGVPGSLGGMGLINPAATMGLSYVGALDDLQVDFMIRATQAHRNAKVLTAPKTTVMNSETGRVEVYKTVTYVSNTTYNTDTVTTTGVDRTVGYWSNDNEQTQKGITLMVTPTISADRKYVLLNIETTLLDIDLSEKATVNAVDASGSVVSNDYTLPQQETTTVTTRVAVPDRGTVLLGGLTLTAVKEIESGVPILNKIPLINRFFSNRSKVDDKSILLVLVKPSIIIRDEAEQEAVAAMSK
jgi:type II secretory pathway component GspD/PulD (secretin)